jgi:hypothetical protein
MASAGNYQGEVTDLKLRVKPSNGEQGELLVTVTILPDRIAFTDAAGLHTASLDIAFFCGDAKENVIGQAWQTIDLKLRDEMYQQYLREGASYTTRIPIRGDAKFVKAIVYNYAADLLGSAVARIQ